MGIDIISVAAPLPCILLTGPGQGKCTGPGRSKVDHGACMSPALATCHLQCHPSTLSKVHIHRASDHYFFACSAPDAQPGCVEAAVCNQLTCLTCILAVLACCTRKICLTDGSAASSLLSQAVELSLAGTCLGLAGKPGCNEK